MTLLSSSVRRAIAIAIAASRVDVEYMHTPGQPAWKFEAGYGQSRDVGEPIDGQAVRVLDQTSRQLIVWPESFSDGGNFREPQSGDALTVILPDGQRVNLEVTAEPPNKCWRYSDRFQTAIRVNCKTT